MFVGTLTPRSTYMCHLTMIRTRRFTSTLISSGDQIGDKHTKTSRVPLRTVRDRVFSPVLDSLQGDWCMCLCFSCFLSVLCLFSFGILLNLLFMYKSRNVHLWIGGEISEESYPHFETLTGQSSCPRVTSLTVSVCVPRLTTNHFLCKSETLGIFYWMQ